MAVFFTVAPLGILIVILGILNMMGNVSSLHSYHRHRVRPEDVPAFGRRVGRGTVIYGASLVVFSILFLIFDLTSLDAFVWVGTGLLLVGLAVGLFISLRAIIKYNKGLF